MPRFKYLAVFLWAITLGGCATMPPRTPFNASDLSVATVIGQEPVRFWAQNDDDKYRQWGATMFAQRQAAGLPPPRTLLALSGGADKGAYSAGLLNAWSRHGDRPSFDVVTGVSTGSLIAPFAFLGADEDAALTAIYTNINARDIYHKRVLGGLFGGVSLLDTRPLQGLIARYVTPAFLDRIAAEHRHGRRLLIMTTNLDAQRGVIWDMGAIASSDAPRKLALFRQVLLASASIPGAFPPVLIDVRGNGKSFAEMHVDGGAVSGFFVLPRTMLAWGGAQPKTGGAIYVLYNGRLEPEFDVVKPRTFGILSRALSTVLGEIDRTNVEDLRAFVRDGNNVVRVCSIEKKTSRDSAPLFDTAHMRELYALGEQDAVTPEGCLSHASRTVTEESGKP